MTQVYLLNGTVAFWPQKHKLVSLVEEGKTLALSNPASRCLDLLIRHHGEVILRDTFFQQVWINNGAQVTNNTFYQNISLLRRAFKEFGLNEEWIVTVPKVGIKLEAQLPIDIREVEDEPVSPVVEPAHMPPVGAAVNKPPGIWRKAAAALTALGVCAAAGFFTWRSDIDTRLQHFVLLENLNGCQFFVNPDAVDFKKHQDFAQNFTGDCRTRPWVYLSAYKNFSRLSALSCREAFQVWGKNQCVTRYIFLSVNNDNT
ncbi:transcriptional regulator [Atlantibacter sp.]|uniref:transcriptional regulator n=1 Tax=Atlantibacter sp. TaxID=1903473 RepID=UPI0028A866CF|nr:transcriptional regulator [Atlantibacter sp.]